MDLCRALRVDPGECIAFSGSGGKTTALFALARQLGAPVLVTTTTHLSHEQLSLADRTFTISDTSAIERTFAPLENEVVLLIGEHNESGRVSGVPEKVLEEVLQFTKRRERNLLIEADGSRQRPMKSPAPHEPVIPSFVDSVVVVTGLTALGKPLTDEWVHRVDIFAELADMNKGEEITIDAIIQVLIDPLGGLKGIPEGVRKICLLNQADNVQMQAQGNRIARKLLPWYEAAIVASFKGDLQEPNETDRGIPEDQIPARCEIFAVHEQIAAIILAAGGSDRMGRTKQLLPWRGEPLVRHVARAALDGGIDKVIVVVGATGEEIKEVMNDLPVEFVDNPDWQLGQSSSIQAGLAALPGEIGAAIFLLADQPQVSTALIRTLIEEHASTLAPIIAPMVDSQRGNPVLFDRKTFTDLKTIRGDTGGRTLFSRYTVDWIDWHDETILLDIDTDEDYQRLLADFR
jgi:molybdenum cofactor cytidylyltransferase